MDEISHPLTPKNIEAALDAGDLYIQMKTRRWWKLRRNGKTQRWKTRPNDFRIPIKFGLKNYGAIEHSHFIRGEHMDPENIRYVDDIPPGMRT